MGETWKLGSWLGIAQETCEGQSANARGNAKGNAGRILGGILAGKPRQN